MTTTEIDPTQQASDRYNAIVKALNDASIPTDSITLNALATILVFEIVAQKGNKKGFLRRLNRLWMSLWKQKVWQIREKQFEEKVKELQAKLETAAETLTTELKEPTLQTEEVDNVIAPV